MAITLLGERNIRGDIHESGTKEELGTWFGNDHAVTTLVHHNLWHVVVGNLDIETIEDSCFSICTDDIIDIEVVTTRIRLKAQVIRRAIGKRSATSDLHGVNGEGGKLGRLIINTSGSGPGDHRHKGTAVVTGDPEGLSESKG